MAQKKRRFANHVLQVLGTILNWGKPHNLRPAILRPEYAKCRARATWRKQIECGPETDAERETVLSEANDGLRVAIRARHVRRRGAGIGDASRVTWSIYDGASLEWRQGKTGDAVWLPVHRDLRALLDAAPRTATTIVTGAAGRP